MVAMTVANLTSINPSHDRRHFTTEEEIRLNSSLPPLMPVPLRDPLLLVKARRGERLGCLSEGVGRREESAVAELFVVRTMVALSQQF